jgi:hypothetical protein
LIDEQGIKIGAGIVQIRAYANDTNNKSLLAAWANVQPVLNDTKSEFFDLVSSAQGLNYFGAKKPSSSVAAAASKALA